MGPEGRRIRKERRRRTFRKIGKVLGKVTKVALGVAATFAGPLAGTAVGKVLQKVASKAKEYQSRIREVKHKIHGALGKMGVRLTSRQELELATSEVNEEQRQIMAHGCAGGA